MQLFFLMYKSIFVYYSIGHVISPDRMLPFSLSKGPSGLELDFSFQSRELVTMVILGRNFQNYCIKQFILLLTTHHFQIDELGRILLNFANVIPGGLVCFFASYDYEALVYTRLEKAGILDKIGKKKKVYREPRKSSQVEQVLSDYARCIQVRNRFVI